MKFSVLRSPFSALRLPFSVLLLFLSCDKIPSDQYLTPTGGAGQEGTSGWSNGGTQRALVEKYTGPRCVNCPLADVTLDNLLHQYNDQLVLISINHPVGQGEPFPNQPDLRTPVGTAWDQYFGIDAIPAAYLNRNPATLYDGSMDNIGGAIGQIINQAPDIDLSITTNTDTATRQLNIHVKIHLYNDITDTLTLTLALTEDSLVYRQSSPGGIVNDYVHNHMLRQVLTSTWGEEIPLSGKAGEERSKSYSYTVSNADINLINSNIVGFLSRKNDRTVVNSIQTRLRESLH